VVSKDTSVGLIELRGRNGAWQFQFIQHGVIALSSGWLIKHTPCVRAREKYTKCILAGARFEAYYHWQGQLYNIVFGNSISISINHNSAAVHLHSPGLNKTKISTKFVKKSISTLQTNQIFG